MHMGINSWLRKSTAVAGGVLFASVLLTGAQVSAAEVDQSGELVIRAGCGSTRNPDVPGAQAYWQVECSSGKVRITGWVKDTRPDGKCARVKATYPDNYTYYSPAACPAGESRSFSSPWRKGSSINAYLYTYNT